MERLDKVLANSGIGSRKDVKILIRQGLVVVDGEEIKNPGFQVDPKNSTIMIGGEKLNYKKYIYIMMNKPKGVISATYDGKHKTVVNLLTEEYANIELFPAGRLDIDTEGFILLTNDGDFAHEILSPKKHVPKTYYAKIHGKVTERDIERFKEGITLDDGCKCLPADLEILRSGDTSEISLIIYEGKFHQVKRMFETVEKRVEYLKRIAMGGLMLDEALKPGQFKEITEQELNQIKIKNPSRLRGRR